MAHCPNCGGEITPGAPNKKRAVRWKCTDPNKTRCKAWGYLHHAKKETGAAPENVPVPEVRNTPGDGGEPERKPGTGTRNTGGGRNADTGNAGGFLGRFLNAGIEF